MPFTEHKEIGTFEILQPSAAGAYVVSGVLLQISNFDELVVHSIYS